MIRLRGIICCMCALSLTVWSAIASAALPGEQTFFWSGGANIQLALVSQQFCYPTWYIEDGNTREGIGIDSSGHWIMGGSSNGQMQATCVNWPPGGGSVSTAPSTWLPNFAPGGACPAQTYQNGSSVCYMAGNNGAWPSSTPVGYAGVQWDSIARQFQTCTMGTAFHDGATFPQISAACLAMPRVQAGSGFVPYTWTNANNFGQDVLLASSSSYFCFIRDITAIEVSGDPFMSAQIFDDGAKWEVTANEGTQSVDVTCVPYP